MGSARQPADRCWWIPLAIIPVAVLFLQFPASAFLWNTLPKMRFLQFPWRWLVVLEAPMGIFFASALWAGGRQVIRGDLPIGDLAKVVFYLMAIGYRVGVVGQFTNIIQNAGASAERILEIIHEPQAIKGGKCDLPGLAFPTDPPLTPTDIERSTAAGSRLSSPSPREARTGRGVSDRGEGVPSVAVAPRRQRPDGR